jgi:rRNA maturation RNase YbeY
MQLADWLNSVAQKENQDIVELNFVLMSDEKLLTYNKRYLNHDTYTDVITFDNSGSNNALCGDILMSYDRIRENAKQLGHTVSEELHRVMVHGLLHLCGHTDKTTANKTAMRQLESLYLLLPERP